MTLNNFALRYNNGINFIVSEAQSPPDGAGSDAERKDDNFDSNCLEDASRKQG